MDVLGLDHVFAHLYSLQTYKQFSPTIIYSRKCLDRNQKSILTAFQSVKTVAITEVNCDFAYTFI